MKLSAFYHMVKLYLVYLQRRLKNTYNLKKIFHIFHCCFRDKIHSFFSMKMSTQFLCVNVYIYTRRESRQDYLYWAFRCIKKYQQSFLDVICFEGYNAPWIFVNTLYQLGTVKDINQELFLYTMYIRETPSCNWSARTVYKFSLPDTFTI